MTTHETIPFPELTGDAERDVAALHEYVYKLQEALIFDIGLIKREIREVRVES